MAENKRTNGDGVSRGVAFLGAGLALAVGFFLGFTVHGMDSIEAFTRLVLAKARELTESAHGYVASIDHVNGDLVVRTHSDMFPWQCGVQGGDRRSVFSKNAQGLYGSLWGHVA